MIRFMITKQAKISVIKYFNKEITKKNDVNNLINYYLTIAKCLTRLMKSQ